MQSLRSELVYGEVDYVEAFSDGRQLPDSIIKQWCDCIDHIVEKLGIARPTLAVLGCGDGRFTLPLAQRFRMRGRMRRAQEYASGRSKVHIGAMSKGDDRCVVMAVPPYYF